MKILIIEDEFAYIRKIQKDLSSQNWELKFACNYEEAWDIITSTKFDIILCDHNLKEPSDDKQGLSIIKQIREININTPVILITGLDLNVITPWEALNVGVDDFVTKPYKSQELIARIRAIHRRGFKTDNNSTNIIESEGIKINLSTNEISFDNKTIRIGKILFNLLLLLLNNKGRVVKYEEILDHIWGDDAFYDNHSSGTLRVHIVHLKKILGEDLGNKIETSRGVGYIWKE